MGPEITQQWIRNLTKTLCPCFQTRYMINAYAQNLDISRREGSIFCVVRRNLVRSDRRPGQGEKHENDSFPLQLIQVYISPQMAGEFENRGFIANF